MKKSILRLVVERIVVEDTRVVIQHVVPPEKFRLIPEWWAALDGYRNAVAASLGQSAPPPLHTKPIPKRKS